jgi:DNA-binding response OmpR family regulator
LIRAKRTPFKPRKLLVIEDDQTVVSLYSELLRPHGFQVLIAYDGEAAIPIVESNPDIELVILDLAMPRMDGRQWLRWFRTKSKESPVIVITGYKDEPMDEELMPSVILGKPFDPAEFLDMVGLFCGLGVPAALTKDATT